MENVITWFEIPVKDMARAKTFYSDILQLELNHFEEGGHPMVTFPFDGQNVSGSLVHADDENAEPSTDGVHIFLDAAENLQEAIERVKKAGDEILIDQLEIQSGVVASIIDTEGNRIGLFANE